ncbi:unnamed protein product [Sphagnum balticum]
MKKLMLFCKLCLFHEKLSHCTVPGAIAASSTCTPKGGRSLVPKPQCVERAESAGGAATLTAVGILFWDPLSVLRAIESCREARGQREEEMRDGHRSRAAAYVRSREGAFEGLLLQAFVDIFLSWIRLFVPANNQLAFNKKETISCLELSSGNGHLQHVLFLTQLPPLSPSHVSMADSSSVTSIEWSGDLRSTAGTSIDDVVVVDSSEEKVDPMQ